MKASQSNKLSNQDFSEEVWQFSCIVYFVPGITAFLKKNIRLFLKVILRKGEKKASRSLSKAIWVATWCRKIFLKQIDKLEESA